MSFIFDVYKITLGKLKEIDCLCSEVARANEKKYFCISFFEINISYLLFKTKN